MRVWRSSILILASAEGFCAGAQLDVAFNANYCLKCCLQRDSGYEVSKQSDLHERFKGYVEYAAELTKHVPCCSRQYLQPCLLCWQLQRTIVWTDSANCCVCGALYRTACPYKVAIAWADEGADSDVALLKLRAQRISLCSQSKA